jgi:hypothetical protein
MGVYAYDGFSHYGSVNDLLARSGKLQWTQANEVSVNQGGPNGIGKSILLQGTNAGAILTAACSSSFDEAFFGAHLYITPSPFNVGNSATVTVKDLSTQQLQIYLDANTASISVYDHSGTQVGSTAPAAFPINAWFMFEVHPHISTGGVEVKVNSATVLTLSGKSFNGSGNNHFNLISWTINGSFLSSSGYYLTDFYLTDTSIDPGPNPHNYFLGDIRVETLFAVSNGDTITWTPLANTNWQEISETAFDGDSSYNDTSTVGNIDLFHFAQLRNTVNNVIAVQLTGAYRKDDANNHTIAHQIKISGTVYAGSNMLMSNTYTYLSDVWPINPNTGGVWATTDVNGMQAGYGLSS